MVIFVWSLEKSMLRGPWRILFNSHVLIRIFLSALGAGNGLSPFLLSFSMVVNEFHWQL